MNRLLRVLLACAFLAACGDDPAKTDSDADIGDIDKGDVDEDGRGDVDDEVDAGPDGAGDTDGDVTPPAPTIDFWFVGAQGARGQGDEAVTLLPEDELAGFEQTENLQIQVAVATTGVSNGRQVTLVIDGANQGAETVTVTGDGAGVATFDQVSLKASDAGYEVKVQVTTLGGQSATATKQVTVLTEACDLALAPAAQDGCINEDADPETPGHQLRLTVTHAKGTCDRAELTFTKGDGEPQTLGPIDLDDEGVAVFDVTVAPEGEVYEGSVIVDARVLHPEHDSLAGSVLGAVYAFDNAAPVVTLTTPDPAVVAALTLAVDQDEDPTNGIQYPVQGTVEGAAEGTTVMIEVGGEAAGEAELVDGGFGLPSVSFTQSGPTTLVARATDACGNEGVATLEIPVYVDKVALAIAAPAEGAVLLAKDDGDPATADTFETAVVVKADDATPGAVIAVECRPASAGENTWFPAAQATVPDPAPEDGLFPVPVALPLDTFSNDVVCRASYGGPNPVTSAPVAFVVALPAPTLALTEPVEGAMLASKVVRLAGTAKGLDGQPLIVRLLHPTTQQVVLAVSAGTVTGGVFDFQLDLAAQGVPVTDGTWLLQVDAKDTWGNLVSDVGPAPQATVTIDTVKPLLVVLQPGTTFLDPIADPTLADEDPATPGYQTTIVVQMNNETQPTGAQVCLTVNGEALGCEAPSAEDFTATWTGVTLVPGAGNTVTATGADAFGNAANPLTLKLNLALQAPVVQILAPEAKHVTTAEAVAVTVKVSDPEKGTPQVGAVVTLHVGGADAGLTAADNGDGTYTFAEVPLAPGVNTLQALATWSGGDPGASAVRQVTRKTDAPTVAVTAPADGTVINLQSSLCLGTSLDCTANVTVATTSAEDGSAVTLTVACGAGSTELTGVVAAEAATFTGVTLTHGGDCTLTAQVTDLAGQQATSAPVVVTVDRAAPTITGFTQPAGDFLLYYNDLSTDEGMQAPLVLQLQGVEAGQVVSVDVRKAGQATGTVVTHTVTTTVSGATLYTADFGVVTYPDGAVLLKASVSDAAGNTATKDKPVSVQASAPTVVLLAPTWPGDGCGACASTALCSDGACWHRWSQSYASQTGTVTISTSGFVTDNNTNNLRICSDHPSLAGSKPACATGGYFEIARATATGSSQFFTPTSLLPAGQQTLIAELRPAPGEPWLASLTAQDTRQRLRRVLVDLTPPQVTSLSSPSDTEAPTGVLNAAEQEPSQPARTYRVAAQVTEDGPVDFYVQNTKVKTVEAVGGAVETTLTLVSGGNEIYVIARDAVGNASAAPPTGPVYAPTVDIVAPVLAFDNPVPGTGTYGLGAVLDVVLDVGLQAYEQTASVQATLFDGGVEVGAQPVVGGGATFAGALTEGSHTFTAKVTDPAGNSATVATSPATVLVDLTPPAAAIASPEAGVQLTDDSDPGQSGFQVQVDFSAGEAAGPVDWKLEIAVCPDATFTGCGALSTRASGTATGVTDLTRQLTLNIVDTVSHRRLVLTTTDQAGNTATDEVTFSVLIANCFVSLTNLPASGWLNASHCLEGTACDAAIVAQPTGACGSNTTIELYDGATLLGSQTVVAGTDATFVVPVADGQQLALQAKALLGTVEVGESSLESVTVDLTPPEVTLVAKDVDGFTTPAPPASEDDIVLYNAGHDANAVVPGFQGRAVVRITDANAAGGGLVQVVRTTSGGPATLTPNVQTDTPADGVLELTLRTLTLLDQETNLVAITVEDAAGNTVTVGYAAAVDVQPPAAVALTLEGFNPRLPGVTVKWTAVGDDGTTGTPEAYEIRYSRSPITETDFDSACAVGDIAHAAPMPDPEAAGAQQIYTITGPDPRPLTDPCKFASSQSQPTWYFGIRARDEVGNWSPVTAASVQSTNLLTYGFSRIVFSDTFRDTVVGGVDTRRKFITAFGGLVGDVDGDGFADMLVGSGPSDAICVIYGAADMPEEVFIDSASNLTSLTGPHHDCLVGAANVLPGAVQLGTAVGPAGDVNGDGLADFFATGRVPDDPNAGTLVYQGFVAIWLGVQDQGPDLSAPPIIIRGANLPTVGGYVSACGAGNFTGAVSAAGHPIGSFSVGEPVADRLTVIPGSASWSPDSPRVIDLDALDVPALTFQVSDGASNFGTRCDWAGDLLATPGGGVAATELLTNHLVNVSGNEHELFVIAGRPITGTSTVNVTARSGSAATAEDANIVKLRQEAAGYRNNFPSAFNGKHDVTGDGTPDIVALHYSRATAQGGDGQALSVFDGELVPNGLGKRHRVAISGAKDGSVWKGANGFIVETGLASNHKAVAIFDWDGWTWEGMPLADLFVPDKAEPATLRINHATTPGVVDPGMFPVVDGLLTNPWGSATGALTSWADGGADLSGDGVADAVLGTHNGVLVIVR